MADSPEPQEPHAPRQDAPDRRPPIFDRDWNAVRAAWLQWMQGPPENRQGGLETFAKLQGVPYWTLVRYAPKWKAEEAQKLQERQRQERDNARRSGLTKDSKRDERALNAKTPSPPLLGITSLRGVRATIEGAADEIAAALLDEIRNGKGPSRIAACRDLLDRIGLLKAETAKEEAGPYEHEGTATILGRALELVAAYDEGFTFLTGWLKDRGYTLEKGPHHLGTREEHASLSPLTSGHENGDASIPGGGDDRAEGSRGADEAGVREVPEEGGHTGDAPEPRVGGVQEVREGGPEEGTSEAGG